jgi:transposase
MKGKQKLFTKMEAIHAFLTVLESSVDECSVDDKVNATNISERVSHGRQYSAETVRYWSRDFLVSKLCRGLQYKSRPSKSLIHDEDARDVMNKWLKQATRNTPPCSASDFKDFIKSRFGNNIGRQQAGRWLRELGYNYRCTSSLELYRDGANRPDVVRALDAHVNVMLNEIYPNSIMYTGVDMEIEVKGKHIMEAEKAGLAPKLVYDVIVHDESTAHAKDMRKMRWGKFGEGIGTKN